MRKFVFLLTFFAGAPLLFLSSLLFLLFLSYQAHTPSLASKYNAKTVSYAALPSNQNLFTDSVIQQEARVEMIRQFMAKYGSPLEPHAQLIVDMADRYDLDFRLIPAIAMQESNLCTKNRPESHNCWGWGVYGGKYTYFDSYPEAIETISRTLSEKYKNKLGLVTPDEIQQLYNPSNTSNWAYAVNHFMEKMQ